MIVRLIRLNVYENSFGRGGGIKSLRKMPVRVLLMAMALMLIAGPSHLMSADSDNASSTARVLLAITVTSTQDLSLGYIYGGIPKSMGYNDDDSSAIFSITGEPSAGINLQFMLPEYLSLSDGSARVPIIFSATDSAVDTTTASPSTMDASDGWINQNPRDLPAGAVIGAGGTTRIYLGGKVVPPGNLKAGTYNGDIVLSVSYNGT